MTQYTVKETPTDLMEAARELDKFMQDIDWYGYQDAEYSVDQALADIDNDPGFVVMELIRIARDLMD